MGCKKAHYYCSLTQAAPSAWAWTLRAGGVAPRALLPMGLPDSFMFASWDTLSRNLAEAMRRAEAGGGLQEQLGPPLGALHPRPSVYIPERVAANGAHAAPREQVRRDIHDSCSRQAGQSHCAVAAAAASANWSRPQ